MYFWKINTKPVLKGNRTCDLAEVKMGHYHCTTFSFGDGIIFAHYFQVLFSLPFKNIHLKKSTRQESNSPPHSWEDASNTSWASTMMVLKWTCHLIYMKWHLVTTWRHPVGWSASPRIKAPSGRDDSSALSHVAHKACCPHLLFSF